MTSLMLSLNSFIPSFSPPERPSRIMLLEEGQCLHYMHMQEVAWLMMKQFRFCIEVVRAISTAGFRKPKGQVTLFLAETQDNSVIGHWVCLQFVYKSHRIQIYDSCSKANQKTTWNRDLQKTVKRFFGDTFSTKLMPSPQQLGDTHCGLFAIANAVCIFKDQTLPFEYNQTQMLHHLKKCTKNELWELFPG